MLSDILDEIRVDLQWVAHNGLPIREPLPTCPTLKRMAVDPGADDWGERLVIDYGQPTRTAESAPPSTRSRDRSPPRRPQSENRHRASFFLTQKIRNDSFDLRRSAAHRNAVVSARQKRSPDPLFAFKPVWP